MPRVSARVAVPIGVLVTAVSLAVSVVRAIDKPDADIAALREHDSAADKRIDALDSRLIENDAWRMRVLDDLSKIKERLGIVENRPVAR